MNIRQTDDTNMVPGYVGKILALYDSDPAPPGTIRHADVLHDDWCGVMRGTGECTCDPEVRWRTK
jgi:hypothetical protein